MPKEDDRHTGRRENIWFTFEEHAAMLAAMEILKESNKSNAVAAVAVFVIGFVVGFNACQERERMMDGQRRIGAALEHWHGHTTHRGRTIISPACQAIVSETKGNDDGNEEIQ